MLKPTAWSARVAGSCIWKKGSLSLGAGPSTESFVYSVIFGCLAVRCRPLGPHAGRLDANALLALWWPDEAGCLDGVYAVFGLRVLGVV